jgi:hypothetical protein
LRCLKRQISDAIFACLRADARRAAAAHEPLWLPTTGISPHETRINRHNRNRPLDVARSRALPIRGVGSLRGSG